ncbi:hypothetical protein PHLGIDRAFT_27244 [Phlebiopsis gigantea 11061_1 CR5-6]|uniref:Endonuclease/exonuclease/phosphatase domain-containing protein n=1 Tax=Phlebiopsis gigantea (strain 11061_1 CR5-6) TaxID=745531 RepID=A0A0C3SFN6_PHLG1|nr:hypothetical protein PHLGIDRAFT_27244 [Phlebiopsis gigantea 11061_1 CR5-6]
MSASHNRYELTPEQLALAEERRQQRLQQKQKGEAPQTDPRSKILTREWLKLADPPEGTVRVKVMTWNTHRTAGRELFPSSDCLKASQREHMLYREVVSHAADICCLQEVDRTEKLFPVLKKAGYSHIYKAGNRKNHGSVIAYRKDLFKEVGDRRVLYDEEDVRTEGNERARRGSSFFTKNIGNLVALERLENQKEGFIIATTHLFWHPRQAGILFREVTKFRDEIGASHWPCIVAGDFNFAPDDASYALISGDSLLPEQLALLEFSRVVHRNIDPDVPVTAAKATEEEDEGADVAESDPGIVITNARRARPEDGLLSNEELQALFQRSTRPVSAYDEGQRSGSLDIKEGVTFQSRQTIDASRRGAFEPVWTSYTHYWKTILDYIFVLNPPNSQAQVIGLAKPFPTGKLAPGIPRMGVCGSDHISLCAELAWPSRIEE